MRLMTFNWIMIIPYASIFSTKLLQVAWSLEWGILLKKIECMKFRHD